LEGACIEILSTDSLVLWMMLQEVCDFLTFWCKYLIGCWTGISQTGSWGIVMTSENAALDNEFMFNYLFQVLTEFHKVREIF